MTNNTPTSRASDSRPPLPRNVRQTLEHYTAERATLEATAVCPLCGQTMSLDHNDWHTDTDGTDICESCCVTYGPCWDPRRPARTYSGDDLSLASQSAWDDYYQVATDERNRP